MNQDPGERRAQLFTGVPRTIRGEPIEVSHDDAHVRLTRQNRTSGGGDTRRNDRLDEGFGNRFGDSDID